MYLPKKGEGGEERALSTISKISDLMWNTLHAIETKKQWQLFIQTRQQGQLTLRSNQQSTIKRLRS